jgi:hypothetical protein
MMHSRGLLARVTILELGRRNGAAAARSLGRVDADGRSPARSAWLAELGVTVDEMQATLDLSSRMLVGTSPLPLLWPPENQPKFSI